MPIKYLNNANKFVSELVKSNFSKKKTKKDAELEKFISQLYSRYDGTQANHKNEFLTAKSLFEFLETRKSGETKIRSLTPSIETHGFESDYSIIEIITDDKPFLVDSVTEAINRLEVKTLEICHPVLLVKRNKSVLEEITHEKGEDVTAESVMHLRVRKLTAKEENLVKNELKSTLQKVSAAVTDWGPMVKKLYQVINEFSDSVTGLKKRFTGETEENINSFAAEITDFLLWLQDNNFVFLGYIEFLEKSKNFEINKGSELGIFKIDDPLLQPKEPRVLSKKELHFIKDSNLFEITKANRKSSVHRPVHMDYICIRKIDDDGKVIGEHRFLGLFTSMVYYQSASNIPIIRKKMESVLSRSGFPKASHNGKEHASILESFPRDELFQMSEEDLFDASMGLVLLEAKPELRLFVRKDFFERFISCLIYVPREKMSTSLRRKFQVILEKELNGKVSNHYTQITDSHLGRVRIIIKTTPNEIPNYSVKDIENKLSEASRSWEDNLKSMLYTKKQETKAEELFDKYNGCFPVGYKAQFSDLDAYYDILQIEKSIKENDTIFDLYESGKDDALFNMKIYCHKSQIYLSDIMPILENLGVLVKDEHPHEIKLDDKIVYIHHFRFKLRNFDKPNLKDVKASFEDLVKKIWDDEVQNDSLNQLIFTSNIKTRQIVLIRAYCKYIQQMGFRYSQEFVMDTLSANPNFVRELCELFDIRHNPSIKSRDRKIDEISKRMEDYLSSVTNLSADRVMRMFKSLVDCTLRTNFYQDNASKSYISFKFNSKEVPDLPLPRPYREIFVYSPRVEAVHLRGGKVARGGLRWSDRKEDFRTEVLGLMKAQMTKNTVIVPVGSKGGFVVKKSFDNREDFMNEGVECYKIFLRGLLDVTDNIVDGKTVNPEDVVRYDEDDTYLVVAPDKGTATFSDIANEVSKEYNFWLGDGFASGGSEGYDHKKMGITAKGAWVSVERHFLENGLNTRKENFSVIGIGDMSGDVFGNGMLLSKHIQLKAAFNHLHIFIDPNPDASLSFKERKRLFGLARSSWTDYNKDIISKGGKIYERSAKSIKLSKEAVKAFGFVKDTFSPDELTRELLKADIDLLWNGGIGTYVKARSQSHSDVGDRANDNVRVNGSDLGAKVVGEGGNLGFTQLGRIEFARKGGRINTDSIDNSAGVDCSDHEVNIKIAVDNAIKDKTISAKDRSSILQEMTDEISDLVLRDNFLQTQALTISELQGYSLLELQSRFMTKLEKSSRLDRAVEYLPDSEQISRMHLEKKGLSRPELSVILAYSKLALYDELLESNFPDDEYFNNDLKFYFPSQMRDKLSKQIENHPLRREIISTTITNSMVNRVGPTFFNHLVEDMGVKICDIARAYTIVRDIFGLRSIWKEIESLNEKISAQDQVDMFLEVQHLIEKCTIWFLRHYAHNLKILDLTNKFSSEIDKLQDCFLSILAKTSADLYKSRFEKFKSKGAGKALSDKLARLELLVSACDIVEVSLSSKVDVKIVGKIYFEIGTDFGLGWMRNILSSLSAVNHWEKLSLKTLANDLYFQQRRITFDVISHYCDDKKCGNALASWIDKKDKSVSRYNNFLTDIKAIEDITLSTMVVAVRRVEEIG